MARQGTAVAQAREPRPVGGSSGRLRGDVPRNCVRRFRGNVADAVAAAITAKTTPCRRQMRISPMKQLTGSAECFRVRVVSRVFVGGKSLDPSLNKEPGACGECNQRQSREPPAEIDPPLVRETLRARSAH
jgi:hypothetical protein